MSVIVQNMPKALRAAQTSQNTDIMARPQNAHLTEGEKTSEVGSGALGIPVTSQNFINNLRINHSLTSLRREATLSVRFPFSTFHRETGEKFSMALPLRLTQTALHVLTAFKSRSLKYCCNKFEA